MLHDRFPNHDLIFSTIIKRKRRVEMMARLCKFGGKRSTFAGILTLRLADLKPLQLEKFVKVCGVYAVVQTNIGRIIRDLPSGVDTEETSLQLSANNLRRILSTITSEASGSEGTASKGPRKIGTAELHPLRHHSLELSVDFGVIRLHLISCASVLSWFSLMRLLDSSRTAPSRRVAARLSYRFSLVNSGSARRMASADRSGSCVGIMAEGPAIANFGRPFQRVARCPTVPLHDLSCCRFHLALELNRAEVSDRRVPRLRFSSADDVRQRPRSVRHRWPGRVRRA